MMSSAIGGGVDELDGPRDDAPERVAPDLVGEAGPGERLGRPRVEPVAGERDPRRRPEQVDLAGVGPRLERVRPADLVLRGRPSSQSVGGEVEAVGRDDPALVHRVVGRVAERDEPRLALEVRRLEARRRPRPSRARCRGRAVSSGRRAVIAGPRRDVVEAADPDGDRVDRPSADERDEVVAGLLEAQRPLDQDAVVAGQLDGARRSPGSPGRGGSRRGARGSRSTRRSTAGGGGRGRPGRARCRRRPRRRGRRSSGRRPGRCRRCGRRCRGPRPGVRPRTSRSK